MHGDSRMKASDDPKGMTDDELEAAGRHHATLADTYRRMAFNGDSKGQAAVAAKLADTHKKAADACAADAKRRGIV